MMIEHFLFSETKVAIIFSVENTKCFVYSHSRNIVHNFVCNKLNITNISSNLDLFFSNLMTTRKVLELDIGVQTFRNSGGAP